jgi:hypothetical protein
MGRLTNSLCEVAAFVITDIAGRGSNEPGNRMLLHEFGHVDPNHCLFTVKKKVCKRAGEFGFTDSGGS